MAAVHQPSEVSGEPPGHHESVLPYACPSAMREPPEFQRLRSRGGLTRVRTATGDHAWLVTTYSDLKNLCGGRRLGKSHADPERAARLWDAELLAPEGNHATELQDHWRWRSSLVESFSARSISRQRPRVQATFDEIIEVVAAAGPPADLCSDLARPFAARVICDLIGIPKDRRERFITWSDQTRQADGNPSASGLRRALNGVLEHLLVAARDRSTGLISELANRQAGWGELTPGELANALTGVFLAGYDTVASRIPYGTLYLLAHPEQAAALAVDPCLVSGAVEEIMRLAVPGGSWIPRYALVDFEYQGTPIRAGDLIVLSFQSANRDERVFAKAHAFDIERALNPHVAFGHGKFFCLGAGLARLELEVVFSSLFQRLPGLRLSCRLDELRLSRERVTGGLERLPVTWS